MNLLKHEKKSMTLIKAHLGYVWQLVNTVLNNIKKYMIHEIRVLDSSSWWSYYYERTRLKISSELEFTMDYAVMRLPGLS